MLALLVMASDIYVFNASGRVAVPADPQIALIAHRGMHRTFQRENLDNDTCTAGRIDAHEHELTENTLPSIQAAFAAGADTAGIDALAQLAQAPDGFDGHVWTNKIELIGPAMAER